MKVILLKDVKNIGRAHEAVTVADGHALNFLIPGKFAVGATPTALKQAELHKATVAHRKEIDAHLLAQNIAHLAEVKILLKAKANEKGHLYTAIDASDIVEGVKDQAKIDLPEEVIKLEKPFKEVGTFDVHVSHGEIAGTFSVTIEAE